MLVSLFIELGVLQPDLVMCGAAVTVIAINGTCMGETTIHGGEIAIVHRGMNLVRLR